MLRTLLTATACLALATSAQAQLVIAGGGLEADTQDVWQAFIDQAKTDGAFVIVPSASGSPAQSAASVRKTLIRHGVDDARITVAPLAVRDDDTTPGVNEKKWKRNADDPDVASQLRGAAAIWFTGGDQSRTTGLLNPDGHATPVLSALRTAHASGTPIGGTSAGAAIMSRTMIRQGDSLTALTGSGEGEVLELGDGLGFLPHGLVDQHFGERARLG
ncbi:MAG: cyanophycinase, partial [Litorimonas sp.]